MCKEKKKDKVKEILRLSLNSTYGLNGAKTTTELCPPNPNELDIPAGITLKIRNDEFYIITSIRLKR